MEEGEDEDSEWGMSDMAVGRCKKRKLLGWLLRRKRKHWAATWLDEDGSTRVPKQSLQGRRIDPFGEQLSRSLCLLSLYEGK